MSVYHRIDDVSQMTSARYFKLAERLPAYTGVVQLRQRAVYAEMQEERENLEAAEAMAQKYGHKASPVTGPAPNTFQQAMYDPESLARAREMATISRRENSDG